MKRTFLFVIFLCVHAIACAAMTTQQLTTLKNFIAADPVMSLKPNNSDGAFDIAVLLNAQASPAFTVWKTSVPIGSIGKAFDGNELGNRTSLDNARLQTIAQYLSNGVNPSLASNRQFFDDIFSAAGGVNTRAALLILWKRLATVGEKVFATGTGSDAVPATLVIEGNISPSDVQAARNS